MSRKQAWIIGSVALAMFALLVVPNVHAALLYYDAQTTASQYVNTAYNPAGLTYNLPGYGAMIVGGGKRTTPGSGDPSGNDYFNLNPSAGSTWDLAGLYDPGTGRIGGGNVSGTLYIASLIRASVAAPGAEAGYGAFEIDRPGTNVLGLGNAWNAWAYSIFGVTGDKDLVLGGGGATYIQYDTTVRLMVAKITYNPGAADNITVWLDPYIYAGDNQTDPVRRWSGVGVGDLSFNQIAYRSGNTAPRNSWDFDEVRFATTLVEAVGIPEPASLSLLALGGLALARRRRKA